MFSGWTSIEGVLHALRFLPQAPHRKGQHIVLEWWRKGEKMDKERILVTGGAGFIGSHLVEALLRQGYSVHVLDDLSMGKRENVPPEARFYEGDILNGPLVEQAMEGVDRVVHLAARVAIRDSVAHFCEDAQTNLMGTLRILQQACTKKVKKFIFASSMAVYGDRPLPEPVSEASPADPVSPYGLSKLAAEKYVCLLSRQFGLPALCLRYFNVFGPRQAFTPYVGVITIFIQALQRGEPPTIFGDGAQQRDFVYVGDITKATMLALESSVSGEVFNVGTGKGTSVREIAGLLIGKLRPGIEPGFQPPQPGEVRHSIADISKIRKMLGFRPQGKLAEKIDGVIDWNRSAETG
jgi:UDP-glucose 4-epimerase